MLNQRHAAAQAIADQLFPTEKCLDDAILLNAKLAIATVEGRRQANLPISVGQEALDYVIKASGKLSEARELLVNAHQAFRQAQISVGLRAYSYGDEQECPPSTGELRVVPADAKAA